MGGGDLNLKKSWHPHTMRNQEKVWKAEQAKTQEARKLKDLQKEIEEEKTREELKRVGQTSGILPQDDKKLEWMYKSSTELVNRDEYLLGRTIDKSFEMLQAEEQRKESNMVGVKQSINHVEHECIPFSIRAYRNLDSSEQVDLQRKVMEDPLMLIKQREMESRRKILENPVKLKELHRILKTDQMLKKSKKAKKSKKSKSKKPKKKHKKQSKSSTGEDSTDSSSERESGKDLDKELAKRYKKLNKEENFAGLNLSKLLDAKFDTITKELDKAAESRHRFKRTRKSSSSSSISADEPARTRRVKEQRGRYKNASPEYRHRHSKSPNEYRRRRLSRSRSPRNRSRQQRSHSASIERDRRQKSRSRYRTANRHEQLYDRSNKPESIRVAEKLSSTILSGTNDNKEPSKSKKKLSDEERATRLREMMKNAQWREEDRVKSVQKHRDACAREEERYKSHNFDKDFINKEVKKAIDKQSSIGSRIRSNLNNIQRTSLTMDSNFARK